MRKNFSIYPNYTKRICYILGLKQKELAKLLDVSEVTLNRWASNKTDLPLSIKKTFDILEENHYLKNNYLKNRILVTALLAVVEDFKNKDDFYRFEAEKVF